MKTKLMILYSVILAAIVSVTAWASLAEGNVLAATARLWDIPWARATFFDTYFAFTTIWLWMAYREKKWPLRILWFVLVMTLGNIAVASYMLIQLARLSPEAKVKDLLLGPSK